MNKPHRTTPHLERLMVFVKVWEAAYLQSYLITSGDLKLAVDLVAVSVDEIEARARVYLADRKWGEMCQHSFAAFVRNINKSSRHGSRRNLWSRHNG